MDTVIKKLSEIEIAAKTIMDNATAQLNVLKEEMENKTAAFDIQVEEDTEKKLAELRHLLQEQTDTALSKLKTDTKKALAALDKYYSDHHDKLSDEIYQKIIRM